MNIDRIISTFEKKFKILDTIDLYDPFLATRLAAIRKDSFSNNERILITQLTEDEYVYSDQPGAFLLTLQQHLRTQDISNYFVTIITGNKDIEQELTQVQAQFSTDHFPIQHFIIDKKYKKEIKNFEDTYCVLPWIHVFAGPNGDLLPCCLGDQNLPLGNLSNNTVKEIMSGDAALQLRTNMLNNRRSKSCENCYIKEDHGLPSFRTKHNQNYKQYISKDINSYTPIFLNIELNHLCNFKCRMCNEWFSSSIAQETKAIYGKDAKLPYHYIDIKHLHPEKRKASLEKILDILDNAEQLSFGGGEPLLGQEHYDIMLRLVDLGKTDIEISYNTNLSKLVFKDIKVTDLWKKFSNVTVSASIDASDAVAEYIRHGTVWKDIVDNIDHVKSECPEVDLKISSAVGFLNIQNLILLQQNWVSKNYISADKFSTNCLMTPEFLSVAAVPTQHKIRLEKEILSHIDWCKNNHATALISDWENIISYMMSNDFSHCLSEFRSRMKLLDHHRHESFVNIFPEFQDLY